MQRSGSLRRRIVSAYVLLALVLCICFAAIAFGSVNAIEDKLIDARLMLAAEKLIDIHVKGLGNGVPGDPAVWHGQEIPLELRTLPVGVHEVQLKGRALHVLLRDRAGERYAIVDDQSEYERVEGYMWETLASASIFSVLLSLALGWLTASRVIEPVIALSRAVQTHTLNSASAALEAPDEIGILARAFARRTDEMQGFLLREQLFTGDVSHELRTPLTIILGAAELLEVQLRAHPELLAAVERIRRTAADTADRVGALLLLSRSPESIDAPLIDLVPLIEHEMDRCRPLLQGRPVVLGLDVIEAARVTARPELAAIAIGNLVRNACQCTEQGDVKVLLHKDRLEIEDTGVGVPQAVKARLFDQLPHVPQLAAPGAGLGLAIVRRVADHLGWAVGLESRPAGGSRFTLRF